MSPNKRGGGVSISYKIRLKNKNKTNVWKVKKTTGRCGRQNYTSNAKCMHEKKKKGPKTSAGRGGEADGRASRDRETEREGHKAH